jgi:hypothetical protein
MPMTVEPNGWKILSVMGGNYRVLVSGKQTNEAFSIIDMPVNDYPIKKTGLRHDEINALPLARICPKCYRAGSNLGVP